MTQHEERQQLSTAELRNALDDLIDEYGGPGPVYGILDSLEEIADQRGTFCRNTNRPGADKWDRVKAELATARRRVYYAEFTGSRLP